MRNTNKNDKNKRSTPIFYEFVCCGWMFLNTLKIFAITLINMQSVNNSKTLTFIVTFIQIFGLIKDF